MEIIYTPGAKADLSFWKKSGNKAMMNKISRLIEAIQKEPFRGIGKPELLKHGFAGYWSRRIDREHWIVYKVFPEKEKIEVYSLRGHYK